MPSVAQHTSAQPDVQPAGALQRVGVGAGLLVAMVAVVLGLLFSGAAAAPSLLDPGAVVRWGSPLASVLAQLAAALTIGALALAAFVLPRGTGRTPSDGQAWPTAVLVAAVAAGVWAVAGVAHLVLTYAVVAGRPLDSPTFGAELGLFVTSVSLGRSLLAMVVVAALTCVVALLVRTPTGAVWTGVLALVGLVLQSQTGHAASSSSHELAMSTMFVHLVSVAVWVGALAALALLAGRLGRDLGPSVARFSTIAAWCYVGVAVSGTVNAAIRLGGWDSLTSTYGVLVIAKVVLFGALGVVGWVHRRAVVPRLAGAEPGRAPWLFWRLVVVELAIMGAVSGVAVALASTGPPGTVEPTGTPSPAEIVTGHPLPPAPTPELWLTSFRWDLIPALGCLAAVLVYLRWVRRLARRGDAWPVGRTISLVLGMLLLAWTTSGGPAVYGHVLFSAHMVQHMVLVMVVPIAIVLSGPVTLAARALPVRSDGSRGPREWLLGLVHSRWAGFFAHPLVAAANFAGSMFVFYFTGLFELSLTTYVGHLAMIVHFTVVGYLFLNALIGIDPAKLA
ncbi:MAG: bifunctional copper resistance protein CopD/cytochrome c oxidase assembly protein, partial [Cellulomonadaceae bacterium]|nr:bifunctional copper resistance protein CopD/cytochrome c oxidase assembly protein [Cellulomonadaceae bacterium]